MNKKIIGMRSLKTALGVIISVSIANLLNLQSPSMVASATIISLANNMHDSVDKSINRMLATIVGVLMAILFQLLNLVNPITMGLGVLIIIIVCNQFNWSQALVLATIVFIVIMSNSFTSDMELVIYSFNRLLDTFIGASVGLFINFAIAKPKPEYFLIQAYKNAYDTIYHGFKKMVIDNKYKIDSQALMDSLLDININYNNLRNNNKIAMNAHVDIISVEEINNKFRLVISLILEINDLEFRPKTNEETLALLNNFYQEDLRPLIHKNNLDSIETYTDFYNYELQKIIITLIKIEHNLEKFVAIYGNKDHKKWKF